MHMHAPWPRGHDVMIAIFRLSASAGRARDLGRSDKVGHSLRPECPRTHKAAYTHVLTTYASCDGAGAALRFSTLQAAFRSAG